MPYLCNKRTAPNVYIILTSCLSAIHTLSLDMKHTAEHRFTAFDPLHLARSVPWP